MNPTIRSRAGIYLANSAHARLSGQVANTALAEKVIWKIKCRPVITGDKPISLQPTQTFGATSAQDPAPIVHDSMIIVPGCSVHRPVEIEMADLEWRALEHSGFVEEPMVQLAAWLFGPGCRVLMEGSS